MPRQSCKQVRMLLAVVGLIVLICPPLIAKTSDSASGITFDPAKPQCGHWAIMRSCELLGVPIEMRTLLELLPPEEDGATMLELRNVFRRIGLKATGRRQTLKGLIKGSYPAIAHLGGDHFVTVSAADEAVVRFFDGGGRVATIKIAEFEKEWTGAMLSVGREDRRVPLPTFANRSRKNRPCIEFDRLVVDKGDIPWKGEPITYEFPVHNSGEAPLVIRDIKTNCKCLGVESPVDPIAPGGKGTITLKYSLREGEGPFNHEALVKSNDPSLPLVKLTAAGNTDVRVQISPKYVDLGKIVPGQIETGMVSVHFTGDYPLEITGVSCEKKRVNVVHNRLSQELARQFRHDMKSGNEPVMTMRNTHVLQIMYEAGTSEIGKTAIDTVVIHTNIDGFDEISVPVYARVVNPVGLYPSMLLFADIKPDEVATRTIDVVALDNRPFQIVSVDTGNLEIHHVVLPGVGNRKMVKFSAKGTTLLRLAGASLEIEIQMTGASPTKQTLKLPIHVN